MDTTKSDKEIDSFLQSFGGDTEAAIAAIRERAERRQGERALGRLEARTPARAVGTPVITVSDLYKQYKVDRRTIPAVNGVSFEVYEGEFVALTGSSGSGKSTLLQLIGGLERPTSGSVVVAGSELKTLSDRQLSRFRQQTIGFVFQFFYLQPFLTLERNLEVPGMFARIKRTDRRLRAKELADIVGITDRLNHYPSELSGGQIQRAAVVRALFNNPKLLLADEPTGNLDSKNSAAIIAMFEDIRARFGTTIVVATHDSAIAQHADRALRLEDGRLA